MASVIQFNLSRSVIADKAVHTEATEKSAQRARRNPLAFLCDLRENLRELCVKRL
jgi:hypothetical protein